MHYIKKFIGHLRNHTGQGHAFLWKYTYETGQTFQVVPKINELEFKEVINTDIHEIEEIAQKDEWGQSINSIVKDLGAGHRCYVIKHSGQIVASNFISAADKVWDRMWARTFKLGEKETYGWQAWCIPAYRGNGIMPFLILSSIADISAEYNKTEYFGWTWVSNKSMHRSLSKIGFKKVGKLGFIELCGVRFSYISGLDAFRETRNRVCVHIPVLHRSR